MRNNWQNEYSFTAYRIHTSSRGMEFVDRAIFAAKRSKLPILLTKFHRIRDDRLRLLKELIDLTDQFKMLNSSIIRGIIADPN